jgi:hypothetical protein
LAFDARRFRTTRTVAREHRRRYDASPRASVVSSEFARENGRSRGAEDVPVS